MALKKLKLGPLDNLDDVDDTAKEYYSAQADGKFVLSNAEYNFAAVKAIKDECGARRISEKQAKDKLVETETKLAAWGEHNPEEVLPKVERLAELEVASKGKVPEEKLVELAEQRAKALLVPVEKKLLEANTRLLESQAKITAYDMAEKRAKILAAVAASADEAGFEAKTYSNPNGALNLMALNMFKVDDSGNVVATDTSGFTPGVGVKDVLPDLLTQHSYLGKTSAGGGATGSVSNNGTGGVPNVFVANDMGARAKLQRDNPKEFDRQLKASGLPNWMTPVKPKV